VSPFNPVKNGFPTRLLSSYVGGLQAISNVKKNIANIGFITTNIFIDFLYLIFNNPYNTIQLVASDLHQVYTGIKPADIEAGFI